MDQQRQKCYRICENGKVSFFGVPVVLKCFPGYFHDQEEF